MNRAVVMEIRSNVAVVMTPDGEFRKVKASEGVQVGDEIRLDEAALPLTRKRAWGGKSRYGMATAAAAIMLLLLTPWLVKVASPQPAVAAYLTMDINPSVELGIDGKERVMELHPLNPDGAKLIEGLEYEGQPAETVAAAITDRARDAHYFDSEEGDVFITSVLVKGNEAYEDALTEHVQAAVKETLAVKKETAPAADAVKVSTLSVPAEVREEAKQSGVSSGKMAFYLLAKNEGHEVDLEALKHQSIHNTAKALGGVEKVIKPNEKQPTGEATIDKKSIKTKLKALAAEAQSKRGQEKATTPAKPDAAKPEKGAATDGKTPAEPVKNNGKPAAGSQGTGGQAQQVQPGSEQASGKANGNGNKWKDREKDVNSKRSDDDRKQGRDSEDDDRDDEDNDTDRQDGQQGGKTASTGRHDGGSASAQKDNDASGAKASQGNGSAGTKNSGKTNGREADEDEGGTGSQSKGKSRADEADDTDSDKSQGRNPTKQQERERGSDKDSGNRNDNNRGSKSED
ncbi:anti-sigma-I factor RsgI family protein [Paenibacillus xanthanilyticus]|uniref:Anti-sigma factor domain-containing protein n=1 Tax=Paenibacillus xanthanilyticus TaxID=1783531 RepID=A0ABV8KB57_9BACL